MATAEIPQGRLEGWLEERVRARSLFAALLHVRIPASAATYYLGGITLFLFGIQVVTGTLLALYYKPTPDTAYDSVKTITSVVDFGWLIRSIHHWGANLMIVSLVLHLLRIFVQAAYKYPRELIWVVGVGLLGVTIGFGFTGYLLPWDQKAFWATTVGTEIAGSVPLVVNQVATQLAVTQMMLIGSIGILAMLAISAVPVLRSEKMSLIETIKYE